MTQVNTFTQVNSAINTGDIEGSTIFSDGKIYVTKGIESVARIFKIADVNFNDPNNMQDFEEYRHSIDQRNLIMIDLPNNEFMTISPYFIEPREDGRRNFLGWNSKIHISPKFFFNTHALNKIRQVWDEEVNIDELMNGLYIAHFSAEDRFIPAKEVIIQTMITEVQTKVMYFNDQQSGALNGKIYRK